MTLHTWPDYRSPLDAQNASERKLRARHWMRLRRANTHYGTADLVARAFVILALLVFFALLSNAGAL